MEQPPTHTQLELSIELEAKIRNVAVMMRRGIESWRINEIVLAAPSELCHVVDTPKTPEGTGNDEHNRLAEDSCARAFRLQEGFHRNGPSRNVAEPLSEAKRCFFAACEDVAQVPFGAINGHGKLTNGASVLIGPAKHRVQV